MRHHYPPVWAHLPLLTGGTGSAVSRLLMRHLRPVDKPRRHLLGGSIRIQIEISIQEELSRGRDVID